MQAHASQEHRSPTIFFLLVFALSIPFWWIGGSPLPIPVNLPISALAVFNPLIAALILVYWKNGAEGIQTLLGNDFDIKKIKDRIWYLPTLCLIPAIYLLAYVVMRRTGLPLPDPQIPSMLAPVFFVVALIGAAGEEVGWMGYAIGPLQRRWGAFAAAVMLGVIWQVWHILPHMQQGHPAAWIWWQSVYSVALRVLIVWIYNNAGRSVLAAILVHAMDTVSVGLFPNFGSHYDPFVTSLIAWPIVAAVLFVWGAKTLSRYRYAGA